MREDEFRTVGRFVEGYMPALADSETNGVSLSVVNGKTEHGSVEFQLPSPVCNGERDVIDGL